MISKKNEILQFLIGLEYFHSGCKHVEVAVVCEAWSHGVTIFTPDPLVSDWLSFTKQGRDWLMIISGHRVEERAEEQGVRHDEGAMEQSAVDIIRHTLHFIPDSVLSQQQKLNMIEINRKKLKAVFILHLFSATFVLLDIENFQILALHLLFWEQKHRFLLLPYLYLCKQKPCSTRRRTNEVKGGEIKYALHIRMHAGTRQTFLIPNGEPNSVVSALKNHNVAAMNGTYLFVYCVLFDFFGNHSARIVIS
mgnify:CR=1 FL=1